MSLDDLDDPIDSGDASNAGQDQPRRKESRGLASRVISMMKPHRSTQGDAESATASNSSSSYASQSVPPPMFSTIVSEVKYKGKALPLAYEYRQWQPMRVHDLKDLAAEVQQQSPRPSGGLQWIDGTPSLGMSSIATCV